MDEDTLEFRLLGGFEVRRGGQALALPASRKTRALLAYLVATGEPHPRERLCDLFWDRPADPRAALRWSLAKIRSLVDDADTVRLVSARDRIGFEPHDARVDLDEVRQVVGAEIGTASTEALHAVVERFRGEFLEGLELPCCYAYQAWCTAEREAVRKLRRTVLAALVARLDEEPEEALRYARLRLTLEPWAEDAHLAVIRLLARLGRPRQALEQCDTCARILARELAAPPSRELEALRRSLGAAAHPAPHPVPAPPEARRVPPLVGRQAERAVLRRLVDAAAGGGSSAALLLLGEPGIGKTRLLEELAADVRRCGGQVLSGRAFEAEMVRAYGPWIDALRSIPAEQVPTELRLELAALMPQLGGPPPDPGDRARLFDAVIRLLADLGATRRPLALLLDDIHWLDEVSAALLHFAVRGLAGAPVVIACAARPAELAGNAAVLRVTLALRRDGRLGQLELGPLDEEQTGQLVGRLNPRIDSRRVFAESSGNPLFALELAQADPRENRPLPESGGGAPSDTPGRSHSDATGRSLPDTLAGLIGDRLGRLENHARELLPWAAALGRGFTLEVLSRLTPLPSGEFLRAIEELEHWSVIRAATDEPARFDFSHDLVRQVAYQQISPPRRRLLHLQIARVLEALDDAAASLAGEVAHHAALGGDYGRAIRACIAAGERCLRIFAPGEAAELATRGLRYLEHLAAPARLAYQLELLRVLLYTNEGRARVPNFEAELARLTEEGERRGLYAYMRSAPYLKSLLDAQQGAAGVADPATGDPAPGGRTADPRAARAIADTAQCLGMIEREMTRAAALAAEASLLAERAGVRLPEVAMASGFVRLHAGDLAHAARCFTEALELSRQEENRWLECLGLSRLVMLELERGRPDEALVRGREFTAIATRMGEGSEAPFAAALAALAQRALGEAPAEQTLEQALEQALDELRAVDSKWMLAYVQNLAAEFDLAAGRPERARARAEEARMAAEAVERRSDWVVAHALLARTARHQGDREAAARHLEAVAPDLKKPEGLSARARAAVERAALEVAARDATTPRAASAGREVSTPAPTPPPTARP